MPERLVQKRCLNCGAFKADDLSLDGGLIPFSSNSFPNSGFCSRHNKRMREGWACGDWEKKQG